MTYTFTSSAGPRVTYLGAIGDEILRFGQHAAAATACIKKPAPWRQPACQSVLHLTAQHCMPPVPVLHRAHQIVFSSLHDQTFPWYRRLYPPPSKTGRGAEAVK